MKKILIVGCGDIGKTTALELAEKGENVELITPEEAKERGINFINYPEPPPPLTFEIKNYHFLPDPTQTRAERRKRERTKRKNRK